MVTRSQQYERPCCSFAQEDLFADINLKSREVAQHLPWSNDGGSFRSISPHHSTPFHFIFLYVFGNEHTRFKRADVQTYVYTSLIRVYLVHVHLLTKT